ncbi:MAG: adenylate/guanylate cyclase domain-containing protein [Acidimicrobiales bacterium]
MDEGPRRGNRWRWLRSISVASRIAATIVAVSVVSLAVATIVGLRTGRDLANELDEERLSGLRTTGAFDVANYMGSLAQTATIVANSPATADTIEKLAAAHEVLLAQPAEEQQAAAETIVVAYRERYLEPLAEAGVELDIRDLFTGDNSAALALQSAYAVAPDIVQDPANLDDAGDGSEWSAIHRDVHPPFREVVQRRDLVDLLLIEPDNGWVVYSVRKRPDLGTSMAVGPFSGSVLAQVFDEVRADPAAGTVIGDLAFYPPAGLTAVGAVASPVLDGDELVGVVVLVYDRSPLTAILTAGGRWEESGFPETGESFLVAADGTLRSEPRSFIEDPNRHLAASVEAGSLGEFERGIVAAAGTTVLTQRADDETVNAAIAGDSTVAERLTVTGERAFSTVGPVAVDGPEWFVVSEVGVDVLDGRLNGFAQLLIIGASVFVVGAAFAAVAWSSSILRPIREMSERLGSGERSSEELEIPSQSPVEFHQLGSSFTNMVRTLDEQRATVSSVRRSRIDLLGRMLPPGVADRVERGDLESLEMVPNASVVVVVVVGLGALVRLGEAGSDRTMVDRLHGELDELADRHGLERIKVVGDAYFAACGHNRPYIDHAPRSVSFAADAQDSILELGRRSTLDLDVVVGVDTGPLTVGMTLESRLVYDAWGPTVTKAHHLARLGRRGQVLVTDATRLLLPESIEAEPLTFDEATAWLVTTASVRGPA